MFFFLQPELMNSVTVGKMHKIFSSFKKLFVLTMDSVKTIALFTEIMGLFKLMQNEMKQIFKWFKVI